MTDIVPSYKVYADKGPGDVLGDIPFAYSTDADGVPQVSVYAETEKQASGTYSWTASDEITLGATFPAGKAYVMVQRETPIVAVPEEQSGTGYYDFELANSNQLTTTRVLEEHRDTLSRVVSQTADSAAAAAASAEEAAVYAAQTSTASLVAGNVVVVNDTNTGYTSVSARDLPYDFTEMENDTQSITKQLTVSSTVYSSASTTYVDASDAFTFTPYLDDSVCYGVLDCQFKINNASADTAISAQLKLVRYDGSSWVDVTNQTTKLVSLSGASGVISAGGACGFVFRLDPSERRYDEAYATEVGAWTCKLQALGISAGTFTMSGFTVLQEESGVRFKTPFDDNIADIIHNTITGQSLGAGATAAPPNSTTTLRAGRTAMLNAGVRVLRTAQSSADATTAVTSRQIAYLAPLVERNDTSAGETIASCAAYELTRANGIPSSYGVTYANVAIGGQPYSALKKGTTPWSNQLAAYRAVRKIAKNTGRRCRRGFLEVVLGEADRNAAAGAFKGYMEEMQSDATVDFNAIDGRNTQVPLLLCQMSNWSNYELKESNVPFDQLNAGLVNPGKIYCAGPKYFATYSDGTHLTANGQSWLGALRGEVQRRILVLGEEWKPVYMLSAIRTGSVVDITFYLPVSGTSLTIDTTTVSNPGSNGFRWIDNGDGNAVTISSVTQIASNKIRLQLSATPSGTGCKVGYADYVAAAATGNPIAAGPTTGARGNIRDNRGDVLTSYYGKRLDNWACHQRIAVTT